MSHDNNTTETGKKPLKKTTHNVVGIRYKSCGKIYNFEIGNIDLATGTQVIVDSDMGLGIGYVVVSKHTIEKTGDPLKKVLRVASEKDVEMIESNRLLQEEARVFCAEKAKEYNLELKVVTTETTLDRKRLVFYFTADGRIDFRELVRDLAAKFKTRIEMRQIGVRDEVKMIGALGACGRHACCNLFLTAFAPVTIRMAKEQELSINQSKLSGICGRLMCCLGYEHREPGEEGRARARCKKARSEDTKCKEAAADGSPDSATKSGKVPKATPATTTTEREERPGRRRRRRKPRTDKPAGVKPEGRKPEGRKPEGRKPESRKPESKKPEGRRPKARTSEAGKPEQVKPQTKENDGKKRPDTHRKFWKKKKNTENAK